MVRLTRADESLHKRKSNASNRCRVCLVGHTSGGTEDLVRPRTPKSLLALHRYCRLTDLEYSFEACPNGCYLMFPSYLVSEMAVLCDL